MERGLNLDGFDPDSSLAAALAFKVRAVQTSQEILSITTVKGSLFWRCMAV